MTFQCEPTLTGISRAVSRQSLREDVIRHLASGEDTHRAQSLDQTTTVRQLPSFLVAMVVSRTHDEVRPRREGYREH